MNQSRDSKTIRSIVLLLFVCASHTVAVAQGLSLRTGDSYLFTFDSLSYVQPQQFPFPFPQEFLIRFATNGLTEGDGVKVELFTNVSTAPVFTFYSVGALPPGNGIAVENGWTWSDLAPPIFPELRGGARLTVES